MSEKPTFQPEGFHTVTPSLTIKGAADALEFYKQALGAEELYRIEGEGGMIMHAEIKIGDSVVMLSDEFPEWGALGPKSVGGASSSLMIYTEDSDALAARAVAAGAKLRQPVNLQFWGDRTGMIEDPFGHRWSLATRVEVVSPEEINARAAKWAGDCRPE
ncbi:MAG TPA: VOC family protein [Chthoniobacteraceae bacterium]|jgi:PhnB protein